MTGFPKETLAFLEGIGEHNEKPWFDAHRDLYETGYVAPARAFVDELGPRLRKISHDVQYDPKIGGSIGRINRDIRFSRDKRPYKDHLDLWFWHGDRKSWMRPGFFLRITAEAVWLGSGMHHFEGDLLARYREAVVGEKSGKALTEAIRKVEAAGDYAVGGMARKTVPRGFAKDHPRAAYLLWESLPAMARLTPQAILEPGFSDAAVGHFKATWPVGKWIEDYVVG